MEEMFLVNIDCSSILVGNQATHYTMFVDGSKMSIVYELVEWIRWMFSVEYCFYLTHENSVIHELEDIQLLSKLKNFKILPCGQSNCVHKKSYRTLLKNFKLFVSWNDMKVHKYFLEKINRMSQKIAQKKSVQSFPDSNKKIHERFTSFNINSENDSAEKYNKEENVLVSENENFRTLTDMPILKESKTIDFSSKPISSGESPSDMDLITKKKVTETENIILQPNKNFSVTDKSDVKYFESKKNDSTVPSNSCFVNESYKKESSINEENVSHMKPKVSHKYTRPFSLGEILSNLREDLGEKIKEPSLSENNFESYEESISSLKSSPSGHFLSTLDKPNIEKKRSRVRKRKRSKRQNAGESSFTYALENKKAACELNIFKGGCHKKPNHIRFENDDNYLMEFETSEGDGKKNSDISTEEINVSSTPQFIKNESEELVSISTNDSENLPLKPLTKCSMKNNLEELGCLNLSVSQIMKDNEQMYVQEEAQENVSLSLDLPGNSESATLNHHLSHLLSQKNQFKKGIVIERFY